MSPDRSPADAWQAVLERLRVDLPSATYHTWVADGEPLALESDRLTIGVGNAYARGQLLALEEVPRAVRQVLGPRAHLEVVVSGEWEPTTPSPAPGYLQELGASSPVAEREPVERTASLNPRYLSRYDEVVRPERVVSIPRYYLRWIPYLGVDLAWIPIGFRQVAYFRGLGFEAGDEFQCSHRELAIWSGMSERNLYRKINDPRLAWFIRRADREKVWSVGKDGAPHREALSWVVMMSMPLTPLDQASLERFLRRALASGLSKRRALQAAYEAPLEELLPPADLAEIPEVASPPRGVEQIVERVLGREMLQPETKKLVAALSMKIGGYGESIEITHYFIRHHLPRESMGPGRGWLVQVLRALSQQQGFPAESVVRGGHGTLGLLLGVNAGTVRRWMSETRAGHGGDGGLASFIEYEGVTKYADGSVDLIVRVTRDEPVLAEHETIAASGLEALSAEPDAAAWTAQAPEPHPVMNRTAPNARSDRIRMPPDAQRGTNSPPPDAPDVRIEPQPAAYPVIFGRPSQARSVSGRKGVGGSTDFNNLERGSNTSSDTDVNGRAAQHGRDEQGKGWDLEDLLRRASVHPTTRARLQGASGVAWVSWLLYWASPLGERLIEPTGNAVNRLKEAPMAPMAGAFERLASLGPDGLAELVVPRVLSRFGYNPASQDWDDVMSGGPSDRLRRLVDLLGFDLAAWKDDDEPEELETADAGGYRRRAPSG